MALRKIGSKKIAARDGSGARLINSNDYAMLFIIGRVGVQIGAPYRVIGL